MNHFSSPENTNASLAPAVSRLIDQFNKLPGIGPKTAQRIAYYLIRMPLHEARDLAEIISSVKDSIVFCSICQNIAESDPCALCSNPSRDNSRICVVQEPLDVLSLEKTGVFKGLYHVLNGVIDPMSNIGPEDLKIAELLDRIHQTTPLEIVIATNTTVEGEATAMYLSRLIQPLGTRVTRLARGLPAGGDLEYADELTLTSAFEGRQEF